MNNEMNYEYKVYNNLTAWLLNRYGMDGWELVSVIAQRKYNSDSVDCSFYMKRLISKEKKQAFVLSKEAVMKYKNMNIYEFNDSWSVRLINIFNNNDITIVGQLLTKSEHELRRIRNLGNISIKEISECLEKHGMQIGMLSAENVVNEESTS